MSEQVFFRDVGLRDGLQPSRTFLPTDQKAEWCRRVAAAGVPEIEITSFVPPHIIAQFTDAADVAAATKAVSGVTLSALVVNYKGACRAFDAGLRKVNYVVSASEAHSLSNARRSTDAAMEEFGSIVSERRRRGMEETTTLGCGVATTFGCSIQGEVSEERVVEIVRRLASEGVDEISLADTVGYGNPNHVRRLFSKVTDAIPDIVLAAHFHDTRGLGLCNIAAALEVGVRRFDASLGGLGGCPFAPGATGNVNLEDCVFLAESLGYRTGIDIAALLCLRKDVERWLPSDPFTGAIRRAGLPKTFSANRVPKAE